VCPFKISKYAVAIKFCSGKRVTLKDIHNLGSQLRSHNDLPSIEESLKDAVGMFFMCHYMMTKNAQALFAT